MTLRIKTRAFACKLCAHFYLAIFDFRRVEAAELNCYIYPWTGIFAIARVLQLLGVTLMFVAMTLTALST